MTIKVAQGPNWRPPVIGGRTEKQAAHVLELQKLTSAVGDLRPLLDRLAPTVLQTETFVLDSAGQATRQFRVPFRALAAYSGANALTLASGTPQGQAPAQGPGVAVLAPCSFAAVNVNGYVWTAYGTPGDTITVSTLGTPVHPGGSAGTGPVPLAQSAYKAGFVNAPGANTAIVTLPVVAAGWWRLTVMAGFGGTAEATTPQNWALLLGTTTLYASLNVPLFANGQTVIGVFRVKSDGVNSFKLVNPVAASAGAFYQGSLQADPLPALADLAG